MFSQDTYIGTFFTTLVTFKTPNLTMLYLYMFSQVIFTSTFVTTLVPLKHINLLCLIFI